MPLPSVLRGAKKCTSLTKFTKSPCRNPAAFGGDTCQEHCGRMKPYIKRGPQHPNHTHGKRTLEAERRSSEQSLKLQQIEDAMHLLGMTTAKRSRGRKAIGYVKLNSVNEVKKVLG
jgi:hypothetical protein